ncbi:HNH endonuclease signature motif containing protein [Mycolicibacterium litorale]|uniref:HNH endonuclease n=1 Tax=Mycolicibacterium litorale TaxID=758802 RepID=A0AAD1MRR3_9MYCO|nr:HNH endonuclease signature motif containing protein [Mycolicibacterium litorale]MCV7413835.1 DUF222 domain-containing protein [Mycolicibacterium litorale]TDY03281.1 uncharacterized protein DUF222 [Mycolicibacterium litorale]BBY15075.1 HNH endonuclease [Mycolicibacterium litorale]
MFDDLDDAALVAAIEEHTRAEAAQGAARLAAIAELTRRRELSAGDDRVLWACDAWSAASAEVSAAMGISARASSREMRIALALRDRLPKVAALYADGKLSSRIVSTITWRTRLVEDGEALARIDERVAEHATRWGTLSGEKLERAVDLWVDCYDPAAVIRTRLAARDRDVSIGSSDDPTVTTSLWGRLLASDAEALRRRLAQMVAGVCETDPRTPGQRRADALGALGAGAQTLACQCGTDCPKAGSDGGGDHVVIHVVANQAAVDHAAATDDPALSGEGPLITETSPPPPDAAAVIIGAGAIPTPLLAELLRRGAKVTTVAAPTESEPRYRPSTALDRFVRVRDEACRFPGCTRAAVFADIDHTVPHPDGATHASNLKCLCREHHLLKTFWTGPDGWADHQLPDGTVVWRSPAGREYRTAPGAALFFPDWDTTTATLPRPKRRPSTAQRNVRVPKRRRTREAERRSRIKAERQRNQNCIAPRSRAPAQSS